jgi:hypothetical protein
MSTWTPGITPGHRAATHRADPATGTRYTAAPAGRLVQRAAPASRDHFVRASTRTGHARTAQGRAAHPTAPGGRRTGVSLRRDASPATRSLRTGATAATGPKAQVNPPKPEVNKYGERFAEPPVSVDSARPHPRSQDRIANATGRNRDQITRNIVEARKSIDSALPIYQRQLTDRATALEAKAADAKPEERAPLLAAAGRFRQSAQDIGRVALGTLGVESSWGTGRLDTRRDGPAQATADAQKDIAKTFRAVDPQIGAVDRKTVAGAARVALAHHTMRTLEFDGSLQRAVSQFNGGNRDGMAYTRLSQQNGYVAAVYHAGQFADTVGRKP